MDLIKLKSFCKSKETVNKVKIQLSGRERIIANDTTDKGLISKIYKQFMQLDTRKTNNPIKKMGRRPKQTFLQRRHTDGQQTHEKKDAQHRSLSEKCNQNYNEVSPHTNQNGHHKSANNKCWRGCGEKGTLSRCWWECKLIQPRRRKHGGSVKNRTTT